MSINLTLQVHPSARAKALDVYLHRWIQSPAASKNCQCHDSAKPIPRVLRTRPFLPTLAFSCSFHTVKGVVSSGEQAEPGSTGNGGNQQRRSSSQIHLPWSNIKLSRQLRILELVSVGTASESGTVGVRWQVHWTSWRFTQPELWTPDSHQTTVLHGKHNVLTCMSSLHTHHLVSTAF
jgi:hypothetical protein